MIAKPVSTIYFEILTSSLILVIFLTIFYFCYASKVAENEIQSLVTNVIDSNVNSLKQYDSVNIVLQNSKKQIQVVERLIDSDVNFDDYNRDKYNRNIRIDAVMLCLLIFAIFTTVVLISRNGAINFGEIIKKEIVVFMFLCVVEFYVFKTIISKYTPFVKSDLKSIVLKSLQNKFVN